MAFANPALLANVKPRVISILNANPGAWSSTVSGEVGAFPADQEILAAILEADEMVAMAYFNSVNESLSQPFIVASSNIPHGEDIPFHYGSLSKVEVSTDGIVWVVGVEAKSVDDVVEAVAVGSYVEANAFNHLYKIDGGTFYHAATYGRVEYPKFIRTTVLQSNQSEETLIIATAIKLLTKNASPAPFEFWTKESDRGMQMLIQNGVYQEQNAE